MQHQLKYSVRPERLAVCRLDPDARIPKWAVEGTLFNIVRSGDELSIVSDEDRVPAGLRAEMGWLALRLEGPFPFGMTGVLASVVMPLAEAKIPIFAFSTFDTDYVLIKRDQLPRAKQALAEAGHREV